MKITLLFIFFNSFFLCNLYSCSCNNINDVQLNYTFGKKIFSGKVLSKQIVNVESTMNQDSLQYYIKNYPSRGIHKFLKTDYILKTKFLIIEKYKGNFDSDTVIVYTPKLSSSCGYTFFENEKKFIIYENRNPDPYFFFNMSNSNSINLARTNTIWTGMCTLTSRYTQEHANKLRKIVETNEKLIPHFRLLEKSILILSDKELFTKDKKIIKIKYLSEPEEWKVILFYPEKRTFMRSYNKENKDVIIKTIKFKKNKSKVMFTSNKGENHNYKGSLIYKRKEDEWILKRCSIKKY